jgi:DNA-binding transcriptional MerR regulator
VDEPLLSIGTFSRASLLSVAALRRYHEAGILVPAGVDGRTGYRRYHPSQLTDATILRRLRQLDVPLGDVRTVLEARDPEVTRQVLVRHEARMRDRLAETAQIVAALEADRGHPGRHTPVHVRSLPAAQTLAVRGAVPEADFAGFLGSAFARLTAAVAAGGLVPTGPSGALYPAEIPDDGPQDVEAFVPVGGPVVPPPGHHGVVVGELPAVEAAVLAHVGPYESLGETYRELGRWVAHNAEPSPDRVREVYLVSYAETSDPDQFRTELQWPVRIP